MGDLRVPAVEVGVQVLLVGGAWWLVELLRAGDVSGRVLGLLLSAAVVAASILLVVAAWVGDDRRARRVAAAVGLYAATALLLRILGDGASGGLQVLGASVAVLGVVALLVLSVAGPPDRRRDGDIALGVLVSVFVGTLAVLTAGLLVPGLVPPAGVVATADLVAWSGAGAAGVVLLAAGTAAHRPLLRRAGLAFATLGAANAVRIVEASSARSTASVALEVGAVAMVLVAAVPYVLTTLETVAGQQAASRSRLAAAEAAMAGMAERDHELRTLVSGLSGAARVLTAGDGGSSLDGRRLLVATGTELERLRRMLDAGAGIRAVGAPDAAVGPVLRDLALVHRAGGLDVWVEVEGDPRAALEPAVLAQVVTNLLVNCSQHAPGARVWLRARSRGTGVRVEVADDGPGLASVTPGRGLAISAELVERHHGTFRMLSTDTGCTAVLDLPQPAPDVAVSA